MLHKLIGKARRVTQKSNWDSKINLAVVLGGGAAGRLIEDVAAGKEYVYNALGQLVKYKKDGNDRIFFTYDYSGHLVRKTILQGNLCDGPDTCGSALDVCDTIAIPQCDYVPGDANNNGVLNGIDNVFLNAWLSGGTEPAPPLSRCDANCSGSVNGIDVTYLVNFFKGWNPYPRCCYWNCSTFVSTYYVYSGDQVIAEYNNSGTSDWNYVYGLGQRLARYNGGTKYAYHNDHLGSLRALTTQAGTVEGKQDYYPYGEKLSMTGNPGKYSYNNKEYVDDWGFDLYYYGARFMDPNTGRFITPDPIQDYFNPYSYVGNNPINRVDPTGMLGRPSFNYSSATGYEFGGNPFWWMNKDVYTAWKNSEFGNDYSPMEKLKMAIQQAYNHEKYMAESGSQKDREIHEKNAKWLQYFLSTGNYAIDDSKVPINAQAFMDPTFDEKGKLKGGMMYFSSSTVAEPLELLVGTVIHEATHMTYAENHGPEPDSKTDIWGWGKYRLETEYMAGSYEIQYYVVAYSSLKGLSEDVDKFVSIVHETGSIAKATDYWMKQSYPDLWNYYGPGRKAWRP